jgi:hypothetical protein
MTSIRHQNYFDVIGNILDILSTTHHIYINASSTIEIGEDLKCDPDKFDYS